MAAFATDTERLEAAASFAGALKPYVGHFGPTEVVDVPRGPRIWDLAEQRRALLDTEEGGIPDEEREAFALAVSQNALESAVKVDNYGELMGELLLKAAVSDAAADAMVERARNYKARATFFRGAADRLGSYLLQAIQVLGIDPKSRTAAFRKLEGEVTTFQAKKCPASLEITDEAAVPLLYKRVTVTMPGVVYNEILTWLADDSSTQNLADILAKDCKKEWETERAPLLAAIKRVEDARARAFADLQAAAPIVEDDPRVAEVEAANPPIRGARIAGTKLRLEQK